jgi:hypothetical protein
LVADENHFIGDLRIVLAQENEVTAPAKINMVCIRLAAGRTPRGLCLKGIFSRSGCVGSYGFATVAGRA